MTSPLTPLFRCDAYKLDHRRQYPPGTTRVYSNYTNRRSRMAGVDHVVHFGLQAYIQRYLVEDWADFFKADPAYLASKYQERVARVLGEDAAEGIGASHVVALRELGYLPLRICGLPEGTLVPIGIPVFTVENTHDDFAWLTNFVETGLSAGYWQASTSATIAHRYRTQLLMFAAMTGAHPVEVDYQLHDFSYRGMSSHESAAASGAAHLLSFIGTDSLVAIDWIDHYYGGACVAKSVPATEHSVMSAGTAVAGEYETIERLLDLYPTGTLAVVADTYDLWRVLTEYLPKLKDKIMSRQGTLVIRPDSGDPQTILCGDPDAPEGHPSLWGVVRLLAETFGSTRNAAGYKVLDSHVGVIYGDSITMDRARDITGRLMRMGFVSTTVTYGVGSFTYQYQTRDTFGSAMKATWAQVDGKGVDLFKDPVTDDGTKRSATGRLAVVRDIDTDELVLQQKADPDIEAYSLLKPVWENGSWVRWQAFDDVQRVLNTWDED